MNRGLAALILAALASLILQPACRSDLLHPAEGPGSSYPCGVWGVSCPEGTCCPYKHECGGHKGLFTTCPEGFCCYTGGDDWPGAARDAGPVSQSPATRP